MRAEFIVIAFLLVMLTFLSFFQYQNITGMVTSPTGKVLNWTQPDFTLPSPYFSEGYSTTNLSMVGGVITLGPKDMPFGTAPPYGLTGVFESGIFDSSSNNTQWGNISWSATTPVNTNITFQTRTSNDTVSWSEWDGTTNFGFSPDSSTVGLWHFNEGTGTTATDSSGKGNTGTIYGATWTDGKFGKALSFDGVDDYIDMSDPLSLDVVENITLEAWVNATSVPVQSVAIINKGWFVWGGGYALYINPQGRVCFGVGDSLISPDICSSQLLPLNRFVHVAGVSNGTALKIYINGNLDTMILIELSVAQNNYNLTVGAYQITSTSFTGFFRGVIDEVRIYNRTLSIKEIWEHHIAKAYTNPAGSPITSPAARHIQYSTLLSTEDSTLTPTLHNVTITYIPPPPGPPSTVAGLTNISYAPTYINWTWIRPPEVDFSHVMVYINGVWKANVSTNYYVATGLSPNTSYTIGTRTVDLDGNVNQTWVNYTATTSAALLQYSNLTINNTRPKVGEGINFSVDWNSTYELRNYTCSWNATGVVTNIISANLSGYSNRTNTSLAIPAEAEGRIVQWKCIVYDVLGNQNYAQGIIYVPIFAVRNVTQIANGTNTTIAIERPTLAVQNLTLSVNRTVNNVSINFKSLLAEDLSALGAMAYAGKTYQYLNVEKENITDADLKEVRIKFRVEKSWVTANGVDANTIKLRKWVTSWIVLNTTKLSEDTSYVYFEAVSPTLSVFSVTGEPSDTTPPTVTMISPRNTTYYEYPINLSFTLSETASCAYSLNNQSNVTIANCTPKDINITTGNYLLTVYATDAAGNVGNASVYFTANLTAAVPTVGRLAINETSWSTTAYIGDTLSHAFALRNDGAGNIANITIGVSGDLASKITTSAAPTILLQGESKTITVNVDLGGVSEGSQTAKITVNSNSGSVSADVTINVQINIATEADILLAEIEGGGYASRIAALKAKKIDVSAIDLVDSITSNLQAAKSDFAANKYGSAKTKLTLAQTQFAKIKSELPSLERLVTEQSGGKQPFQILLLVAIIVPVLIGIIFFLRMKQKKKPTECAVCGKPEVTHVCAQCGRSIEKDCLRSFEGKDYCLECAVALGIAAPVAPSEGYYGIEEQERSGMI